MLWEYKLSLISRPAFNLLCNSLHLKELRKKNTLERVTGKSDILAKTFENSKIEVRVAVKSPRIMTVFYLWFNRRLLLY